MYKAEKSAESKVVQRFSEPATVMVKRLLQWHKLQAEAQKVW